MCLYTTTLNFRSYCAVTPLVQDWKRTVTQVARCQRIAYASPSLSTAEKKYAQLDKEALSLVFGISKFHKYLYGRDFVLQTDHFPLIGLLKEDRAIPAMVSARIQRWALNTKQLPVPSGVQTGYEYLSCRRIELLAATRHSWTSTCTGGIGSGTYNHERHTHHSRTHR